MWITGTSRILKQLLKKSWSNLRLQLKDIIAMFVKSLEAIDVLNDLEQV